MGSDGNIRGDEENAWSYEQGDRARKLFAAVVLAVLDDAIDDCRKHRNGVAQIARWARSRDGREVLSCAGIDPNERVVGGLMAFVDAGQKTSVVLSGKSAQTHAAAERPQQTGEMPRTDNYPIAPLRSRSVPKTLPGKTTWK